MEFFNHYTLMTIFGIVMEFCEASNFIVFPKNITANMGDNIFLHCKVDPFPIHYSWEYKNINLSPNILEIARCYVDSPCRIMTWDTQVQISLNNKLTINNISSQNSGEYTCEAMSNDNTGPIRSSAIVTVKTPPTAIGIHFNRSKNVFQENEYIAIQCTVSGSIPAPKISITIIKNNVLNPLKVIYDNPQQLSSTELSAIALWRPNYTQHRGYVMCTATNDAGNLTKNSSLLNIKYEPKIKQFPTSTIVALVNQTIDLNCDVTANPAATVHWIIMNGPQKIDSSDLTTQIKPEMAGTLTCKANNSIGSRSKSLLLVVLRDPIITIKPIYRIKENSDNSIICLVESVPSPDFIRWYKLSNNSDSPTVLISNDAKLSFIRTDRSSSGLYACVTQNTQIPTNGNKRIANTEKIIHIIVTYKPSEPRILVDNTISIRKGDSFILNCSFNLKNPGEPLPVLKWLDVDSKNFISESHIFMVAKSESKHNGRYQCLAQNKLGSTLSTDFVVVSVNEPPSVISNKINKKVFLNYAYLPQSIDFICTFRGQPLVESKWRYEKEIIIPSKDYIIEIQRNKSTERVTVIYSRLTVNLYSTRFVHQTSSLLSPNGKYSCEVSNLYGIASMDYFLIIKYPPYIRIDRRHRKTAASLNQNSAIIRCQAESISNMTINWFKTKDNFPIASEDHKFTITTTDVSKYDSTIDLFAPSIKISDLTISDLDHNDFTNYSCVATNDQGPTTTNFELVFKSQPDPPIDLKVKNIEWDSVTISWIPGFNGGLEQSFEIQVTSEIFGLQNVPFYSDKTENTLTITGLHPSTHYEIRIYAINSIGRSSSSALVKCVTKRIHKFDKIRAEILPDQPKIAVVVQESDLCATLEYTRDNGRQWFSILHCVRFNASHINETIFLDIARITSMLDLQSGLIHLRLTFCLLSRPGVCSSPKVLENPRSDNLTTQTVILVIAIICFLLIIILIALFIVCCIRFRYHCVFCNQYYCCGCCFQRLYDSKNKVNRHYNNRKACDNKPISCSRVSCADHLDEVDITTGSTSNYCSSLIGSTTPHIMNTKCSPNTTNEIYSSFICPHHEFRPQIPILYEGSSFLQPAVLSWSQKISPPSCEASSSHSHSSTGSSGRNLPQNSVHYRKKQDVISNHSVVNLKTYNQIEEKIKLPDVTSEAIHFVKPSYDEKIMEAVV